MRAQIGVVQMKRDLDRGLLLASPSMDKDERSERRVNELRFDATAYVQTSCIGLEDLLPSSNPGDRRSCRETYYGPSPESSRTEKSDVQASRPILYTFK